MPALSFRAAGGPGFSGFAPQRISRLLVFGGEPVFGSTRVVFGSWGARCLAPSSPPEPTLGNGSLPETQQLKGEQAGYRSARSKITSNKLGKFNAPPFYKFGYKLQEF